jgi:signal transduction histidine kinase
VKAAVDAVHPTRVDALDRAAERVVSCRAGDRVQDSDLMRQELRVVAEGVRVALATGSCEFHGPGQLDRVRLLGDLRTELLRSWSRDDAPLLPLMQALEVANEALVTSAEAYTLAEVLEPTSRSVLREVAHLLRSPLGSIVMLADTMRDERSGPLSDMQKYQIDIIHRAALAIATTAGDLLTHMDEDPDEHPRPLSVAGIMQAVADVVRPVAEARRCRVMIHESVEELRAGPTSALTRVLLALALRLADMTQDGSVALVARAESGLVHFSVRAQGLREPVTVGADELLTVFRTDPNVGGPTLSVSALALSAAATILDHLGSELAIESPARDELLATFSLSLPPAN